MALIQVDCPICEKDDAVPLFYVEDLQLVRCKTCGLTYYNPDADPVDHIELLNEDFFVAPVIQALKSSGRYDFNAYLANVRHTSVVGYPDYLEPEHLRAKELWGKKVLSWFIKAWQDQGFGGLPSSILEMGCASGHMLLPFKQAEWNPVVGQEVSEWILQYAAPGIDVRLGDLHHLNFTGERFDCVLCWDSFEHTDRPNETLRKIREVTNDQMLMIWQTPDVDQSTHDWYLWSPRGHCFFWSRKTASLILNKHGFEIIGEKISPEADEMVLLIAKIPSSTGTRTVKPEKKVGGRRGG